MVDFIDKTLEQSGTPINRANLMAMQGFQASTTIFKPDGSIETTNSKNEKLTTIFNSDGSITEIFEGEKTITKKTIFEANGMITEEIL